MAEMINVQIDAKQIVLDWMGSSAFIPSNKKLLRIMGDTNTILLAESINQYKRWADKGQLQKDGSFYWTQLDCELETGYSRATQQRAFKDMQKRGLLKVDSRKVEINGEEKSVRFIKLYFNKIAELMFSDDTKIIEEIKSKYKKLKKQNQQSKKKKEEEKSMTQNESSLEPVGMIQNESLGGMIQNESSRMIQNESQIKKTLFIKKDLEEEEEEKHSALIHFLLTKDITLENAVKFENRLLELGTTDYTYDDIRESLRLAFIDFQNGDCKSPYLWAAGKVEYVRDSRVQKEKSPKQQQKPQRRKGKTKPSRVEKLPDWFDKDENAASGSTSTDQEQEQKKREIEDMLKKLRA